MFQCVSKETFKKRNAKTKNENKRVYQRELTKRSKPAKSSKKLRDIFCSNHDFGPRRTFEYSLSQRTLWLFLTKYSEGILSQSPLWLNIQILENLFREFERSPNKKLPNEDMQLFFAVQCKAGFQKNMWLSHFGFYTFRGWR